MKIIIDGEPLEIAKMLQAIGIGKEHSTTIPVESVLKGMARANEIAQRTLLKGRGES